MPFKLKLKIQYHLISLLVFLIFSHPIKSQFKHIYLANDNHTDYYWAANAEDYINVALNEIDFYLDFNEDHFYLDEPFQNRYNLDCAWYTYTYMQHRSAEQFQRLVDQLQSGHFSMPLNWLVSTYGAQPTEAVLRGMYLSGKLERAYDLDIDLVASIENQTQPLGLASLWAGSGAKYSWKGVCGCVTELSLNDMADRENEIYHYKGLDGSSLLMKWYSLNSATPGGSKLGGYAEAASLTSGINQCDAKCNTPDYPFNIAGAFGHASDAVEVLSNQFPSKAMSTTNENRQVYVSNELDFFQHFENAYDLDTFPSETVSYGNEWDLNCATLAPITSKIKRSVEKLRTAEALASVVSLVDDQMYLSYEEDRGKAWMALGSYWEHNFGLGGCCYPERNDWHIMLQEQVSDYVNSLHQASLNLLAQNIDSGDSNARLFVFNSLSWPRSDYVDLLLPGSPDIHVIDVETQQEIPAQIISTEEEVFLRLYVEQIPPVGYRVFEIIPGKGTPLDNTATLNDNVFENDFYRITFTSEGVITGLVDKQNGFEEYISETNGRFFNDFGQGDSDNGTAMLLNNGPVSATLQCTAQNPLEHSTLITLFKNSKKIEIKNTINDNFGDDIRSYSFSLNLDSPTLFHEELGAILKAKYQSNGGHYANLGQPGRYDWLTLNHFADIGNDNKRMTISNSDASFMKLGSSTEEFLDENAAQINVLIGGVFISFDDPGISNQYDLTEFENSFAFKTYSQSFDPAASMKFALEHQNPLVAEMIIGNRATLPEDTFSMLNISEEDVLLWALKPSEEGYTDGGLIMRVWNFDHENLNTTFDFTPEVTNAQKTTHLETNITAATIDEGNLLAEIGQQKMETFRIFPDTLVSALSSPIKNFTINIYPNPATSNELTIELPKNYTTPVLLKIYNSNGQIIQTRSLKLRRNIIETNHLPAGIYLFKFEMNDQSTTRKVFISN